MIPSGNLSAPNTSDSISLFTTDIYGTSWTGVTPRATELTSQCLVDQRIIDLPQVCGPNCRYNVSVLSFVIQCTPNSSSLSRTASGTTQVVVYPFPPPVTDSDKLGQPAAQPVEKSYSPGTLWNGTIDEYYIDGSQASPEMIAISSFFLVWHSTGPNGTSGNASCSPVQAQYDVEVRTITLSTRLFLNINSRS
jgi:hypothetical protein